MQNPMSRRSPLSTPPNALLSSSSSSRSKVKSGASTSATNSASISNKDLPATPLPYALASPRVRETLPRVTVKLATPPSTPSRRAMAGAGIEIDVDEMGARPRASGSDRQGERSNRMSDTTEFYTPISSTRSAIPPPLPPRPQSSDKIGGIKLVTPGYGTPLTTTRHDSGSRFGFGEESYSDSGPEGDFSRGPGALLVTPGYDTPLVSPRTEASEMGYNIRPGGCGSTGPYGDGLGLGLPSLNQKGKGSLGSRYGKGSVGLRTGEGSAGFRGIGGDDPLGLRARAEEEYTRPTPHHQRRPSERPLMEAHSESEMDGIIVDRRRPRPSRDVFFDAVGGSGNERDEAMERNKRLVDTLGPFVYAFGMLERPAPRASSSSRNHTSSGDTNTKDDDRKVEGSQSPLRPSVPLYERMASGNSWFSAFSSDGNARTTSQSTGQTLVNPPALGFSAQILRTHTRSAEPSLIGPNGVRELREGETVWDALHSLPRGDLDRYQPLIRLSTLFRGRTVPAIDFLTTKLALLSALIEESRTGCGEAAGGPPASTAFVTFRDPRDARRATKELAAHPKNMLACVVTPAPDVRDIDWGRAMKSTYTGEFVKDWVVNVGVW
jgi:hypothetical protein